MEALDKWNWVMHPTLMVNTGIAKSNIKRMAEKAKRLGLRFRPHFKTHQSAEIGEWFREAGATCITVSSLQMARYFADAGWSDITVAFPVNVRAMPEINALASRIRLGILVSDVAVVGLLASGLQAAVDTWIEIDSGDGRSGFNWDDANGIVAAAQAISETPNLRFAGLLGHGGFTYKSVGLEAILSAHAMDLEKLLAAKEALQSAGWRDFQVSTGDTPACSRAETYAGVDEIRPGNFVFYDVQQQQIGSCGFEQIAVALACPVVAIYPHRSEVIIHGGGVHLGKDGLPNTPYGLVYGRIARLRENDWAMPEMGCYLRSISQEHGVAVLRPDFLKTLKIGELLAVLPIHSCMTADLMGALHPVDLPEGRSPIHMMSKSGVL